MDEKARIKRIMELEGLNASQFASEVGIPASTISHIFTGRNKLSSAVTRKILNRFGNINPEWLYSGVGTMHRQKNDSQTLNLFSSESENTSESINSNAKNTQKLEQEKPTNENKTESLQQPIQQIPINIPPIAEKPPRRIKRIIVYFDDNSFQEFIED